MQHKITLYKRAHPKECLAAIEKKLAKMKARGLQEPPDRGKYLAQYADCHCPWQMRGFNRFGQYIRKSTGCAIWEDAVVVRDKTFNTDLNAKPAAPMLTLQQAIEKWDKRRLTSTPENPVPARTRKGYLQTARELVAHLQASDDKRDLYFYDITVPALYDLQTVWKHRVKATTANRYRTHLSIFCNFFIESQEAKDQDGKLMLVNPVSIVKPLPTGKKRKQTLPLDTEPGSDENWQWICREMVPFFEARKPKRSTTIQRHPKSFLALCKLMYYTGLRISDAIRFQPALIEQTRLGNWKYTTEQTKTHESVTCYLPTWLVVELRSLPLLHEGYPFLNSTDNIEDYIGNEVRTPLKELGAKIGYNDVVHKLPRAVLDKNGKVTREVKDVLRPHRFRDSFAINEINRGCSLEDLSKKLGHKSIATTEKFYLPWIQEREDQLERNHFEGIPNVVNIGTRRAG